MSAVVTPGLAPHATPNARVVVIVGGGFCGTVLAIKLLRSESTSPLQIILIERGMTIGRGVAYAATNYPFLLNVTAARMSLNPEDSLEFLRFARGKLPGAGADDFLPRSLYGEYLEKLLRDAQRHAPEHLCLHRVRAEVRSLEQVDLGVAFSVELNDGRVIFAHDVVLATGNPPPATLPGAEKLLAHPGYIARPWSLLRSFHHEQQVLVVGTGLSMADALIKLSDDEQQMPTVHAISRRGLLPLAHERVNVANEVQEEFDTLLWSATSVRRLLRATRNLVTSLEQRGRNWRELIMYLRHIAPKLWQRLPLAERRRFARHVQCYWDVCRHLLPQPVSEHIRYLRELNKLHIHAGRIEQLTAEGERIRVRWRRRGQEQAQEMLVDAVINATGPDFNVQRSREPLLQALYRDGLVMADPVGLGIRTTPNGEVIDSRGKRNTHLFYLGPLLRANDWETTAAPELCGYAERLAEHLASRQEEVLRV